MRKFQFLVVFLSLAAFRTVAFADDNKSVSASKAPAPVHSVLIDEVQFDVVVQAPHLMVAPIQVFGAFLYENKNDGFSGADIEMDEGFKGAIQELRKKHGFGRLAETLVLSPPAGGGVGAQRVLLMGLGNIKTFKPKDMQKVGAVDIREACQLGLTEFSHASDVQDGGMVKFNAGTIAENVVIGMTTELRLHKAMAQKGLMAPCKIEKISYLAGPKFLKDTISYLDKTAKKLSAHPR